MTNQCARARMSHDLLGSLSRRTSSVLMIVDFPYVAEKKDIVLC